jgi:hypothetical protein
LTRQLTRAGFVVRVQQRRRAGGGISYPLANVIAFRDGSVREAIALVAHYDTTPDGPGAADDALGVAICLEAARALSSVGLRHSLAVILTDGEEVGLLGAQAAVTDPEIQARVQTFLNFDAAGGAGPLLLFQMSPELQTAFRAWPADLARAQGGSFLTEIVRNLPAGTDFSVFSAIAPGLNFASIGDAYAQHTTRDTPERVSPETLRTGVATAIAGVRALDSFNGDDSTDLATYFDLGVWHSVVIAAHTASALAWTACALALLAWIVLTQEGWHTRRLAGLVTTAAWSVASASVSLGGMALAGSALASIRREASPWYAFPQPFVLFLSAVGSSGLWLMSRLAASGPRRLRPRRSPNATWWTTLPLWTVAVLWLQMRAPLAAYLVSIPLSVAAIVVVLTRTTRAAPKRIAAAAVAVAAASLWLQDSVRLMAFLVPFSATAGMAFSATALVEVMFLPAVMLAPPILAALSGMMTSRRGRASLGWVLAFTCVTSGAVSLLEPAYTAERPQRRQARYIQDDVHDQAWLEVGSAEPGLDVLGNGVADAVWQPSTGLPGLTPFRAPFMFQTSISRQMTPTPLDIRTAIERAPDGSRVLDIVITPHEYGTVALLPVPGLTPMESASEGSGRDQPWRTVAAAMEPLHLRGAIDSTSTPKLDDVILIFESIGLPLRNVPDAVRAWLASDQSVWRGRAVFIVRALGAIGR